MASVSREKIALVVFVLLVLFGIGLLIAYLNIGHNWNVTASQIDDATGELEGYTVILYAGTVEEPIEDVASSSAVGTAAGGDSADGSALTSVDGATGETVGEASSREDAPVAAGASVEEGAAQSAHDSETAGEASSGDAVSSALGPTQATANVSEGTSEGSADARASQSTESAGTSGSRASGGATPLFASSSSSQQKNPVSVEDVAASYREKDAQVLVIDVEDLGAYEEGTILKRGDRRIGVFSVAFNEPLPRVQAKVDELRAASVDFVVAITPDRQFVESATGVDIALSLTDEGSSFLGGTVNGTYYVDSPLVGQVGAVLVSPHNVVSAKDVTEL